MKAVIFSKYGSPEVLKLAEVEKPVPKGNEVLIKVAAVVVGIEDSMQRSGRPFWGRIFTGFTTPKFPILGTEFAGEIEAVGKDVRLFHKGDQVFGVTGFRLGGNAEYVCMPENGLLSKKLPQFSYAESAPVCGALQAWNLLVDKASIQPGQKVLINDAAGSIGTAALQIAKALGVEVTGVTATDNFEFIKSLGADRTINHYRDDSASYDVVLDVTGRHSYWHYKDLLKKDGFYLTTYPAVSTLWLMFWTRLFGDRKVIFSATGLMSVSKRLEFLKKLIPLFEKGKVRTIIDKKYLLDQIVEAHKYIEQGQVRGNVVIELMGSASQ